MPSNLKSGLTENRDISTLPLCCLIKPFVTCFKCGHRECIKCIGTKNKIWQRVRGVVVLDETIWCQDCYIKLW